MDIASNRNGNSARVSVSGEVDATSSPQLETELIGLVGEGVEHLTLDLQGVTFLSSSGLSALLHARKVAATLQIEKGNNLVDRILDLTDLTATFEGGH
jgi:anti-sigma B factor antagonist